MASLLKRAPALPFAAYAAAKSKLTPRAQNKNLAIIIARYAFTLCAAYQQLTLCHGCHLAVMCMHRGHTCVIVERLVCVCPRGRQRQRRIKVLYLCLGGEITVTVVWNDQQQRYMPVFRGQIS